MEKNRYLVFEIQCKENVSFSEAKNAIQSSVLGFLGELETAKSGFKIMKDFKKMKGIIKTNPKYVNKLRTSLSLINNINKKKAIFNVIKVSGTLKKAREGMI